MNKNVWLLSTACLFITTQVHSTTSTEKLLVPAFTAKYNISRKNDTIGTAIRKLRYITPNVAEYSYQTHIEWLIFSDKRAEISTVKINNSHLTPTHYRFNREGTGSDKSYDWTYDVSKDQAYNVRKKEMLTIDFPENIQDKLSYHLQNRFNLITNPTAKKFVYPVISTSGKIKDYEYVYDGEEELMLPYGLVKSVRFKREVVEKDKVTYAWFAPEHNYLMVKLRLEEDGVAQFQAQLDSYTLTAEE